MQVQVPDCLIENPACVFIGPTEVSSFVQKKLGEVLLADECGCEALLYRMQVAQVLGDFKLAQKFCDQAAQKEGVSEEMQIDIQIQKGKLFLEQKAYTEALDIFEAIREQEGISDIIKARVLFYIGCCKTYEAQCPPIVEFERMFGMIDLWEEDKQKAVVLLQIGRSSYWSFGIGLLEQALGIGKDLPDFMKAEILMNLASFLSQIYQVNGHEADQQKSKDYDAQWKSLCQKNQNSDPQWEQKWHPDHIRRYIIHMI